MKVKFLLVSLLVVTGMAFSGCDKIKSLADVKFNADIPANFDVNLNPIGGIESGKSASISFDQSLTVDPTSNADIEKYLNNIKDWQINEITGTYSNVDAPITLDTLKLQVYSDTKNATWLFTNVTIDNAGSLTLNNTNGQWATVNSILDDKTSFTARISGSTTSTTGGTQFSLDVVIKTTITANPF
ncbi:MAG: hypothetical protein JXR65_04605 [Bacteroidales bacterium]|nr:hypothetical protein [Bacteroidales bacterium]